MPEIVKKEYLPAIIASVLLISVCGLVWLWYHAKDYPVTPIAIVLLAVASFAGFYFWRLTRFDSKFRQRVENDRQSLQDAHGRLKEQFRQQAVELQKSYRNYQELVESANSIILRWDPEGVITYANSYALDFFGFSEQEFIGRSVMETIVPETESTGRDLAWMIQDIGHNPQNYIQNENENICKDHRRVWVSWTNKAVLDDAGNTIEILSIGHDATDKKHYERQIHQLAHYDNLTQLPNRALFANRLNHAIGEAHRYHREVPVFYIDLDRFKPINDSLGHHRGDLLLQQLSGRMLSGLRETDTLARMGGDEFAVILEGEENREQAVRSAQQVAGKLLLLMSQPFMLEEHEVFLSGSIGIVTYPHDGDSPEKLLKHADTAMYQAKSRGKNCFLLYENAMSSKAMERLKLETELRTAIVENSLEIHYQPAINLETDRIGYVEALLRWNHPQLGSVSPQQFIDIAEETGLMVPLGKWVLEQAIRQAKRWQQQGFDSLMVAVNLSLRQFENNQLVDDIAEALAASDLPAKCLALEITESTIMSDTQQGHQVLNQISDMGVSLLIDDFGTGYSSLARLRGLPIRTIKIDRSFVFDITTGTDSGRQIVDAIIAMAHNLNMQVIAEGVETDAQKQYLKQRSCDCIQGFLISQAKPAHEISAMLAGTAATATAH